MSDLFIVATYKEKGHFSSKECTERASFYTDLYLENPIERGYMIESLKECLNKALRLFNSTRVYDVEVAICEVWDKKLLLVRQSWRDKENDTFEVYDYMNNKAYADINKMSKKATFEKCKKVLNDKFNEIVV